MTPVCLSPLLCAVVLSVVSACSSSDETVNGSTTDCNQLENQAPVIRDELFADIGGAPIGEGGEIRSGTYQMVKASFFGAPSTCAPRYRKATLNVVAQSNRAGRLEYSLGDAPNDTAPIRDDHVSSTYETTGTSFAERASCPISGDAPLITYTASPTSLTLISAGRPCGTFVAQFDTR
jgi:hypothetical protein